MEYQRRRSTGSRYEYVGEEGSFSSRKKDIVYKTRAALQKERLEAAEGLQQLGEGLVYSTVCGLAAPTAPNRRTALPTMEELPRRIDGLHPREHARQVITGERYHESHEYMLPKMVPTNMHPEISAASSLCKIKKGIQYVIKKVTGKKKDKKVTFAEKKNEYFNWEEEE